MKLKKLVIFKGKLTNFFVWWDFALIFSVNYPKWHVLSGELFVFSKKNDDFFALGETEVSQ